MVERPDAWWVADLRCVPGDSTVTLEPRAGGALIEANAAGASLLWFHVIAIDPPRSINFAGAIAPPFGGPCQAFLLVELEERDGATVVRVTNSMHGQIGADSLPDIESGWRMLFEDGLKRVAEAS